MKKKDAMIIKKFRRKGTWRKVATLAAEQWPQRGYLSGNQIEGMELCHEAAQALGEKPNAPPWN